MMYLQNPISNGNSCEQALIRRWWHEVHQAKGKIVWEYYLNGKYADAIWFPHSASNGKEFDGKNTSRNHPIKNFEIVLCEAKKELNPEVVGQALIYSIFAKEAGANLKETIVFCETGSDDMRRASRKLDINLIIRKLDE